VAESKLWRLYAKLVADRDGDDNATKGDAESAFKAAQLMQVPILKVYLHEL
jgi:hypothetical protein